MSWKKFSLGELAIKVGSGATPRGGSTTYLSAREKFALVRSQNVLDRYLSTEQLSFITDLAASKLASVQLTQRDVLLNITGDGATFGRCCMVPDSILPAVVNQHVSIIRTDQSRLDPGYLLSFLCLPTSKTMLDNMSTGGSRRAITKAKIESILIPLPPLPTQRRIASVLSAYDDLIENNTRRIGLLEEMARMLYRESFHARPSCSTLLCSDGSLPAAPSGWSWQRVEDVFKTVGGGTPSRAVSAYWEQGEVQWFSPSDLTRAGTAFMDDSSDHITALGLAESGAKTFPPFSVMMTSRATIGAISINTHAACTNQGFITCIPNERAPIYFLLNWLRANVPEFIRLGTGATFKEITRGLFRKLHILLPPPEYLASFEELAGPYYQQILCFERTNRALRAARDLLLPKLLSGELSVDRIPDPAAVAP